MQLRERLREFSRMSLLIATFRLLGYLRAALWRTCSDKHRVSSDDKSADRKHAPHLWWCLPPQRLRPPARPIVGPELNCDLPQRLRSGRWHATRHRVAVRALRREIK